MCMRHSAVSAKRLCSLTDSLWYESGSGHTQPGPAAVAAVPDLSREMYVNYAHSQLHHA